MLRRACKCDHQHCPTTTANLGHPYRLIITSEDRVLHPQKRRKAMELAHPENGARSAGVSYATCSNGLDLAMRMAQAPNDKLFDNHILQIANIV